MTFLLTSDDNVLSAYVLVTAADSTENMPPGPIPPTSRESKAITLHTPESPVDMERVVRAVALKLQREYAGELR